MPNRPEDELSAAVGATAERIRARRRRIQLSAVAAVTVGVAAVLALVSLRDEPPAELRVAGAAGSTTVTLN